MFMCNHTSIVYILYLYISKVSFVKNKHIFNVVQFYIPTNQNTTFDHQMECNYTLHFPHTFQ